ncbi:MAG: PA domain-containing protein [bacterium]
MNTNEDQPSETPDAKKTKIVLVDRGECSFVTKVRNAERQGASLVVVVDNRTEDITNVVMGDDGTGTGIRVPSMLIGS